VRAAIAHDSARPADRQAARNCGTRAKSTQRGVFANPAAIVATQLTGIIQKILEIILKNSNSVAVVVGRVGLNACEIAHASDHKFVDLGQQIA
jgi:hypothetical protein